MGSGMAPRGRVRAATGWIEPEHQRTAQTVNPADGVANRLFWVNGTSSAVATLSPTDYVHPRGVIMGHPKRAFLNPSHGRHLKAASLCPQWSPPAQAAQAGKLQCFGEDGCFFWRGGGGGTNLVHQLGHRGPRHVLCLSL